VEECGLVDSCKVLISGYLGSPEIAAAVFDFVAMEDQKAAFIRAAASLWTASTRPRVAHPATGEQKQKKRTYDVLPKPANLIRVRTH
jgi:hypothetical protein